MVLAEVNDGLCCKSWTEYLALQLCLLAQCQSRASSSGLLALLMGSLQHRDRLTVRLTAMILACASMLFGLRAFGLVFSLCFQCGSIYATAGVSVLVRHTCILNTLLLQCTKLHACQHLPGHNKC